jgi:hypothetical protein
MTIDNNYSSQPIISYEDAMQVEINKKDTISKLEKYFNDRNISPCYLFHRTTSGFSLILSIPSNRTEFKINENFKTGEISIDGDISLKCVPVIIPFQNLDFKQPSLCYIDTQIRLPVFVICVHKKNVTSIKKLLKTNKKLVSYLNYFDHLYANNIWNEVYSLLGEASTHAIKSRNKDRTCVYEKILGAFNPLGAIYGTALVYASSEASSDQLKPGYLVKQIDWINTNYISSYIRDDFNEHMMIDLSSDDIKFSVSQFFFQCENLSKNGNYYVYQYDWRKKFVFKNSELNKFNDSKTVIILPIWVEDILHERKPSICVIFFNSVLASQNIINFHRIAVAIELGELAVKHAIKNAIISTNSALHRIMGSCRGKTEGLENDLREEIMQLFSCRNVEFRFYRQKSWFSSLLLGNKLEPRPKADMSCVPTSVKEIIENNQKALIEKKTSCRTYFNEYNSKIIQFALGINDKASGIIVLCNKESYKHHVLPFDVHDVTIMASIGETIAWMADILFMEEAQAEFYRVAKHEVLNADKVIESACVNILEKLDAEDIISKMIEDIRQRNLITSKFLMDMDFLEWTVVPETNAKTKIIGDVTIRWLQAFRRKFNNKGMGFHIFPNIPLNNFPRVRINQDHFDLIMFNLIGNAFKYGHDYSNVVVKVEFQRGTPLIIRIINYGEPWSEGETDLLFEKYFRGESAKKRDDGSGLGLNISRNIASAYGILIKNEKPVCLSQYELPAAHYLLEINKLKGQLYLTEPEESQIIFDINSLPEFDSQMIFVRDEYVPPLRQLALKGPFSRYLMIEKPTYHIEFKITIPESLTII